MYDDTSYMPYYGEDEQYYDPSQDEDWYDYDPSYDQWFQDPVYDDQGGFYDPDGNYYDASGGYYDPQGGYYHPDGGYFDPDGGYYDDEGNYYSQDEQGNYVPGWEDGSGGGGWGQVTGALGRLFGQNGVVGQVGRGVSDFYRNNPLLGAGLNYLGGQYLERRDARRQQEDQEAARQREFDRMQQLRNEPPRYQPGSNAVTTDFSMTGPDYGRLGVGNKLGGEQLMFNQANPLAALTRTGQPAAAPGGALQMAGGPAAATAPISGDASSGMASMPWQQPEPIPFETLPGAIEAGDAGWMTAGPAARMPSPSPSGGKLAALGPAGLEGWMTGGPRARTGPIAGDASGGMASMPWEQPMPDPYQQPVMEGALDTPPPRRRAGVPVESMGALTQMLAVGGKVAGPGGGQDDEIPAMLSDGEYVIDAATVSDLGDGSTEAGAKKLDQFRKRIRSHKRGKKSFPPKAKPVDKYLG